tara:strand:- start:57 stop:341 length:285 start_codon:yes stop_codon:yes gene_type:complete
MSWKDIIKEEAQTEEEAWKKYKATGEEQIAICPYCQGTGGGMVKPLDPNIQYNMDGLLPPDKRKRPHSGQTWQKCGNCEGHGKIIVPPRHPVSR